MSKFDEIPFQDEVKRALELTRRESIDDPGPMWPRLLAFGEHDKLVWSHIDPSYMAEWKSKNLIGGLIVKACFESRVAIFLSDGYGAMSPPEGKTFDDMPRNFAEWPKALIREALLIFVNARGMKGLALMHGYTRDGNNRRVFASEPDVINVSQSRFCYDLTEATREGALLDALFRNRNGELEASA